ncbi:MAG: pyrroline-5-carboxylate reductase family protein, partial [Pseudomonadales bacterium]
MTESTASAASLTLPKTIAFIGGGNMAQALLGGLLASGADPTALRVSDPSPACREALAALGPLTLFDDNAAAADGAEAVVLAVKPQVLGPILTALAPVLAAQQATPFVLSIAAGIDCASLLHWSGGVPVVRAMPNTPALLRSGVTALFATPGISAAQRGQAEALMAMAGTTYWLEEEGDLAAVTAASGSGPAYFFRLMEGMIDAAVAQGLTPSWG